MSTHSTPSTPNKKEKNKRLGTSRDVAIGLGFFVVLLIALTCGASYLCQWKESLDNAPSLDCSEPCWSVQGDHLAFLQKQPSSLGPSSVRYALWTVDSHADSPSIAVKDLEEGYHIVGWFDNDDSIILQNGLIKKQQLILLVVNLKTRQIMQYNFSDPAISIVGHSPNEIFLQRSFHNDKTQSDEIELLTWSIANPELARITSIPNHDNEQVAVDSVTPNNESRLLAIVLRSQHRSRNPLNAAPSPTPEAGAESYPEADVSVAEGTTPDAATSPVAEGGSEGAASPNPELNSSPAGAPTDTSNTETSSTPSPVEGPELYSVWILNRYDRKLNWTSFSTTNPDSVATAWASDSSWLACVANFNGYTDLAMYSDNDKLQTVRLRTYDQEGSMVPQIRSLQRRVHLISPQRVLIYDFAQSSSTIWADSSKFGFRPLGLALATNSDALALIAHQANSNQIYVGSLSSLTPEHVNLSGKNSPPTLLYDVATGLECARKAYFH